MTEFCRIYARLVVPAASKTRFYASLSLMLVAAMISFAKCACLATSLSIIHTPQGQGDVSPTSLVIAGNVLYGTTHQEMSGPTSVFKVNLDGTNYTTVHVFEPNSFQTDYAIGQLVVVGNTIYGVTASGGTNQAGTIYTVNSDGTDYQILHTFGALSNDASGPQAGLTLDGNVLYGTTYVGGTAGHGAIYKIKSDGSGYALLHSFAGNDGQSPFDGLTVSGGKLWGTTPGGGTGGKGTIYSMAEDGSDFTVLHSFSTSDGYGGSSHLVISGNSLYGTASGSVNGNVGFVYTAALDGSGFRLLHSFAMIGLQSPSPGADLVLIQGTLYGTTSYGTTSPGETDNDGTIFKINMDGTNFATLHDFSDVEEKYPIGTLVTDGTKIYGLTADNTSQSPSTIYGTVFSINLDGSGYGQVCNFYGGDGVGLGDLILDDNVLYGASGSGPYGYGAIFKVNPDGTGFTILRALTSSDGYGPQSSMTLAGHVFYGTTLSNIFSSGGVSSGGVFKVNQDGTGYSLLHIFNGTDGYQPAGNLAISNDTLYGVTQSGGTSNVGTIFAVNTDGTNFRVLHSFTSQEGSFPQNGLTLNGNTLYGTTQYNTVYKINTDGTGFTIILGSGQRLGLLASRLLIDGSSLYGLNDSAIYAANLDGTNFHILHTFQKADGQWPFGSLTLVGTTLYGVAQSGGDAHGDGTAYSIQEDGTDFHVFYLFNQMNPSGAATLVANGTTFYLGRYRLSPLPAPSLSAQGVSTDGADNQNVLWTGNDNSMSAWHLNFEGVVLSEGPNYGPYADAGGAWHAKAVKTNYSGLTRVLWARDDGAVGIWSLDQSGNEVQIGPIYGPYSDTHGTWSAVGLGVAGDGTARVLWKRSDGAVGLWWFSTNDSVVNIGSVYGPYPGWNAQGFDVAPGGDSRVLWARADRAAGMWTFDTKGFALSAGPVYGPFSDTHGAWSAASVGVAGDGTSHVLWKRSDGAMGLWTFDATDTKMTVGSVYGPYSAVGGSWSATALGVSPDGTSSVLWTRPDRAAGVWSFGANDAESLIGSVYGPF